jgi:hypothetical protein
MELSLTVSSTPYLPWSSVQQSWSFASAITPMAMVWRSTQAAGEFDVICEPFVIAVVVDFF